MAGVDHVLDAKSCLLLRAFLDGCAQRYSVRLTWLEFPLLPLLK